MELTAPLYGVICSFEKMCAGLLTPQLFRLKSKWSEDEPPMREPPDDRRLQQPTIPPASERCRGRGTGQEGQGPHPG
ncbi:hypothetical protein GCM10010251_89320 [Streptomyces aurantiogriseus]|uniref:Uncharacterized protein n=1 Tax=Streptomyces aurantiogriseus TaxID=66870 RepID=A0A918KZQ3_9ACTN|nr:hypothetical protein GCM10010251_89320 [Streptomyces aurantiogriseus]